MTLAALFVAQATNTDLSLGQQAAIFGVAVLTTKGAGGSASPPQAMIFATSSFIGPTPTS